MNKVVVFFLFIAAISAFPQDPVIKKYDRFLRYQYMSDPHGVPHLVDTWLKASDVTSAARYDAFTQNVYHLFTRSNPSVSQPLVSGVDMTATNFSADRRTVVIIHGWLGSATTTVNAVLVPAFLGAEDVNVIVVDWSAGSSGEYAASVANTSLSGVAVASFLAWMNSVTGASIYNYHIVGFSLGGQQAGIVGRNVGRGAAYVTALDPAYPGWADNDDRFTSEDGIYTEVIHTNAGVSGFITPLGDVDFYPNGGSNMPGCGGDAGCNHDRSVHYFAESISSGGFTGISCETYEDAMSGACESTETLNLGGIEPKTGSTGIYFLLTNAAPPFSLG